MFSDAILQLMVAILLPLCSTMVLKPPKIPNPDDDNGKCELISTFSLITQAFLGLLCLLCLILKRLYEHPFRRTWQVWLFDVLKQIIGAMGLHVCNLCIAIIKGKAKQPGVAFVHNDQGDDNDDFPGGENDACDWYFLNITFDCTIGVFVFSLIFHLVNRILTQRLAVTQIESGQYGPDLKRPSFKAYFKQLAVYFGSLMMTKVVLFYIMEFFSTELLWFTNHFLLFWLTDYPDEFEIFIVMFVWPIFMNCLQLILVDNIIRSQWLLQTNNRLNDDESEVLAEENDVAKLNYGTFQLRD